MHVQKLLVDFYDIKTYRDYLFILRNKFTFDPSLLDFFESAARVGTPLVFFKKPWLSEDEEKVMEWKSQRKKKLEWKKRLEDLIPG